MCDLHLTIHFGGGMLNSLLTSFLVTYKILAKITHKNPISTHNNWTWHPMQSNYILDEVSGNWLRGVWTDDWNEVHIFRKSIDHTTTILLNPLHIDKPSIKFIIKSSQILLGTGKSCNNPLGLLDFYSLASITLRYITFHIRFNPCPIKSHHNARPSPIDTWTPAN